MTCAGRRGGGGGEAGVAGGGKGGVRSQNRRCWRRTGTTAAIVNCGRRGGRKGTDVKHGQGHRARLRLERLHGCAHRSVRWPCHALRPVHPPWQQHRSSAPRTLPPCSRRAPQQGGRSRPGPAPPCSWAAIAHLARRLAAAPQLPHSFSSSGSSGPGTASPCSWAAGWRRSGRGAGCAAGPGCRGGTRPLWEGEREEVEAGGTGLRRSKAETDAGHWAAPPGLRPLPPTAPSAAHVEPAAAGNAGRLPLAHTSAAA